MPRVANAEAVSLHAEVASAVQAGDPSGAESPMRRIVAEAAAAIEEMGNADARPAATTGRRPNPQSSGDLGGHGAIGQANAQADTRLALRRRDGIASSGAVTFRPR